MRDQESSYEGDFVQVATADTPTEGHVLHGVLTQAGLNPQMLGAETVRMWSWMSNALGGVRLLVPQTEEAAARQALAEYAAGQLVLPGESADSPEYKTLPAPIFNPDRATLLGFVLTPVFPVAVQLFNASVIGPSARRAGHWVWLAFFMAATLTAVAMVMAVDPGPFVVFRGGMLLLPLTCLWYILAGQKQTRMLLSTYGLRYRKRPLLVPGTAVAVVALALGAGLNALV